MDAPSLTPLDRIAIAYGIATRELYGAAPTEPALILEAVRRMDDEGLLSMSDEALLHRLGRAIRDRLHADRQTSN